jgi:hypothetical protein
MTLATDRQAHARPTEIGLATGGHFREISVTAMPTAHSGTATGDLHDLNLRDPGMVGVIFRRIED